MPNSDVTVPVSEEQLTVETRTVPTGQVRVETQTEILQEIAEGRPRSQRSGGGSGAARREVETPAAHAPARGRSRIIPVLEEQLVISKRLVLKEEESHIRRAHLGCDRSGAGITAQAACDRDAAQAYEYQRNLRMESYENRTLTAFFDDQRVPAETARQRLQALCEPPTRAPRLTGGDGSVGRDYREQTRASGRASPPGVPDEDSGGYRRHPPRRLSADRPQSVHADVYDRAVDILDDAGPVDDHMPVLARGGLVDRGGAFAERACPVPRQACSGEGRPGWVARPGASRDGRRLNASLAGEEAHGREDEVIPVVEERLRVGKRNVNLGPVRVPLSYVVEGAVSGCPRFFFWRWSASPSIGRLKAKLRRPSW